MKKTSQIGLKQANIVPSVAALFAAALLLAACGDKPPPPKLFVPQREALDKAKGVEQTEAQHAEDVKREEEKQTQ